MTPCEKFGYKVGDKFICLDGEEFETGTELTLVADDNSDSPKFSDGVCSWYMMLGFVQPLKATPSLEHLRKLCQTARMSVELRPDGDLQVWDHSLEDCVTVSSELEVLEILNAKIVFLEVWNQTD